MLLIFNKKLLLFLSSILFGYYVNNKINPKSLENDSKLSRQVTIKSGTLQGFVTKSRDGHEFNAFLGIPYAAPPIKNLRFEPPQPTNNWNGVRDATKFGNECLQVQQYRTASKGFEDCLYLNVFTPHNLEKNEVTKNLLPVMVYIHGGLFVYGSSNLYYPDYFMDYDIVLVTINYRLGVYGFLNTGDSLVKGNMGLKDQVMALKWTQQNIKQFGGDPKKVTIFGESAGAASVHYHMLSPMSKNLFHQGISQSGVALNPWALQLRPEKQVENLVKNTNCSSKYMEKIVKCLKGFGAEELVQATRGVNEPLRHPVTAFVPTIERSNDKDSFLTQHPESIIKSGHINHVPWVVGVNSHEGLIVSPTIFTQSLLSQFKSNLQDTFSNILWFTKPPPVSALEKIKHYYLGQDTSWDDKHDMNKFHNWTNLISDSYFNYGHHKTISMHSGLHGAESPLFLYYYSYKGQFSLGELLFALKGKLPLAIEYIWYFGMRWIEKNLLGREIEHLGSSHFDEVTLLFPVKGAFNVNVPNGHADYQMSKGLVEAWISFAKNRNNFNLHGTKWPKIETASENTNKVIKYMKIDANHVVISQPFADRMKFWENLDLDL